MKKVLVVDDERNIREVLAAVLQDEGYSVRTAIDGRQALDQLHQDPPDLVLLDVMLPGLDGRELIRRMQQQSKLADIPVVLISTAAQPALPMLGAAAFLPKPFDLAHLLNTVARVLGS